MKLVATLAIYSSVILMATTQMARAEFDDRGFNRLYHDKSNGAKVIQRNDHIKVSKVEHEPSTANTIQCSDRISYAQVQQPDHRELDQVQRSDRIKFFRAQ